VRYSSLLLPETDKRCLFNRPGFAAADHVASCNWVDLLQVSLVQFMCCEQALTLNPNHDQGQMLGGQMSSDGRRCGGCGRAVNLT